MWNHKYNYNIDQQGIDKIHDVILKKYYKYPSTKILNHANILAEVNKSPYVSVLHMTAHDAYSIKIHMLNLTMLDISSKKRSKIPL